MSPTHVRRGEHDRSLITNILSALTSHHGPKLFSFCSLRSPLVRPIARRGRAGGPVAHSSVLLSKTPGRGLLINESNHHHPHPHVWHV